MQTVQLLRSALKCSSPLTLWPTNDFSRVHKIITKNLRDAKKTNNHIYSYAWKEDVLAPPRFIKFTADGTWLHSTTGNKFLDSTFGLWLKNNIHKFEHVLKEAVLKGHDIYIYGKYHERKFHVYFTVAQGEVTYGVWTLKEYFPDEQAFHVPDIKQNSTIHFGPSYTQNSRDYVKFFPAGKCIAFPIKSQIGRSIDLGVFEMLVFVSNNKETHV